jgi:NAD(P)H-nitrite reductase large subunit
MLMRKKKLVMVGNGMAGVRTLEELLKIAPEQYEITVFGGMLQKSLEERGLKFLLGKQTEMLIAGESGRVAAVRLKDGLQIPAELVVMAVGIRPNTALAASAGIY